MSRFTHQHLPGRAGMAAVAAVLLLTAACGGGGSADQDAVPTKTSAPSPTVVGVALDVTGSEYSFAPTELKAAAGPTTIRFTNKGAMEHDFVIKALNIKLVAQPGKTAEVTVALKPGTYPSHCSVPGHSQSGMQGTLIVS